MEILSNILNGIVYFLRSLFLFLFKIINIDKLICFFNFTVGDMRSKKRNKKVIKFNNNNYLPVNNIVETFNERYNETENQKIVKPKINSRLI